MITHIERFEAIGDLYYRRHHRMRPGKSEAWETGRDSNGKELQMTKEQIPERCERCQEVQPNYRLVYGLYVCGICIEHGEIKSAQTVDDGGTSKARIRNRDLEYIPDDNDLSDVSTDIDQASHS